VYAYESIARQSHRPPAYHYAAATRCEHGLLTCSHAISCKISQIPRYIRENPVASTASNAHTPLQRRKILKLRRTWTF